MLSHSHRAQAFSLWLVVPKRHHCSHYSTRQEYLISLSFQRMSQTTPGHSQMEERYVCCGWHYALSWTRICRRLSQSLRDSGYNNPGKSCSGGHLHPKPKTHSAPMGELRCNPMVYRCIHLLGAQIRHHTLFVYRFEIESKEIRVDSPKYNRQVTETRVCRSGWISMLSRRKHEELQYYLY